jgi:hypothetical protein
MDHIRVEEVLAVFDRDLCGSFGYLRSDADIRTPLLSTLP